MIYGAILRLVAANGGLRVTRIMYHSYLSYPYVTRFLGIARDTGLLDYDGNTRLYKISQKGLEYLKFCVKIEKLIKSKKTGASAFVVWLSYTLFFQFAALVD